MPKTIPVRLSDFDYELPPELIAQNALPKRPEARLLVLNRTQATIEHRLFGDIADYFESGDVLVLNDTKVVPARLFARRKTGGRVEILVLGPSNESGRADSKVRKVLIKPSGRVREGEQLILDQDLTLRVLDAADGASGIRHVEFETGESVDAILDRIGRIPLPPYIDREDLPADRELYQTIFARSPGAVASPTAGLHFDAPLLKKIEEKGVEILFVTLHVSYGTFQPVTSDDLSGHRMYEEYFEVSDETSERINFAKMDGRRIVACGTTVVRALESARTDSVPPEVRPKAEMTELFIYPPYEFKIVDRMITNFHLPKSTLLMLTSAFAGHEFLMHAYGEAIRERYRFYSYGDAMFIL